MSETEEKNENSIFRGSNFTHNARSGAQSLAAELCQEFWVINRVLSASPA